MHASGAMCFHFCWFFLERLLFAIPWDAVLLEAVFWHSPCVNVLYLNNGDAPAPHWIHFFLSVFHSVLFCLFVSIFCSLAISAACFSCFSSLTYLLACSFTHPRAHSPIRSPTRTRSFGQALISSLNHSVIWSFFHVVIFWFIHLFDFISTISFAF